MSHFTKIKTTLKDLTVLKKSLTDLSVQWEAKSQVVKGYKEAKWNHSINETILSSL